MKYLSLIIISSLILSGCSPAGSENDIHPEETYKIVTIENHEYIFISRRPWASEMAITHNANCKNH